MSAAVFVGIDVSKATLDIATHPDPDSWQTANDDGSIHTLVKRLRRLRPTLIVLEATGGYEHPVVAACATAGLPVAVAKMEQEGPVNVPELQILGRSILLLDDRLHGFSGPPTAPVDSTPRTQRKEGLPEYHLNLMLLAVIHQRN